MSVKTLTIGSDHTYTISDEDPADDLLRVFLDGEHVATETNFGAASTAAVKHWETVARNRPRIGDRVRIVSLDDNHNHLAMVLRTFANGYEVTVSGKPGTFVYRFQSVEKASS